MLPYTFQDTVAISPMLTLMVFGMIALMVDLALPRDRKSLVAVIGFIGIIISAICCGMLWHSGRTAFNGSITADDFSIAFQFILLVVLALSIALSEKYIQSKGINYGEYYALLLFSTSGAMLMAAARELISVFIGLEILSIALYVLSGFARTEARSEESAMKYFLLGAFSSGFFLYGIALVYGGTGTTHLELLGGVSPMPAGPFGYGLASPYTVAGLALLIIGLAFKAAIVPFHFWSPDVYEGAPTSVTAFMSAGAKAGAFAAFIRVVVTLLPLARNPDLHHIYGGFVSVLWTLAALTMVLGNVLAVVQPNLKRMLAYSSIAHAGYLLVGLLAQNAEGRAGILFYLLTYTFMNLGAFGILILLARRGQEPVTLQDLRGLAHKQPLAAAVMALFMLSLAGIPPFAGFFGKFYLFIAAVHAGFVGLAVLGVLASVVGAFYYLRVIISMYFEPSEREYPANVWRFAPGATVALAVCALATLLMGIGSGQSWGFYGVSQSGGQALESPDPAAASTPPTTTLVQKPLDVASVR